MPAFTGSRGSTSPRATPVTRSYAPAAPKAAPSAKGSVRSMRTATMRAGAGAGAPSTARDTATVDTITRRTNAIPTRSPDRRGG